MIPTDDTDGAARLAYLDGGPRLRQSRPPTVVSSGAPSSPVEVRYLLKQFAVSLPLIAADLAAAVTAGCLACLVTGQPLDLLSNRATPLLLASLVLAHAIFGLYPAICLHPTIEWKKCVQAQAVAFAGGTAAVLLLDPPALGLFRPLVPAFLFLLPAVPVARHIGRLAAARFGVFTHPALIFGEHEAATRVFRELLRNRSSLLRPLGIITTDRDEVAVHSVPRSWHLGFLEEAAEIAAKRHVYWGIHAGHYDRHKGSILSSDVVQVIPHWLWNLPRASCGRELCLDTRQLGNRAVLQSTERLLLPIHWAVKRSLDFAIAALALVLALPLMAAIACLIKLTSRGPVFHVSPRVGRGGREFRMFKFRTMHVNGHEMLERFLRQNPGQRKRWESSVKLKCDPRVTAIGRFLRRFSLDELPQLLNVLCGEMAIVGPRPMLPKEIELYGPAFAQYCRMPPGITGLWQVSGRSDTSFAKRIRYVKYYLANWSIWLDLWIIARTIKAVFSARGAY